MSHKPLKNPRHEAFARHYVQHGIARHAYVAAGYRARMPATPHEHGPVDTAAWRLLQHVQVKPRIERLRETMAKRADITEDTIATELEEARRLALREGQSAAAVSATVAKAKLAGLMIDRKEIGDAGEFSRMTEAELKAFIRDTEATAPLPNHPEHKTEQ